MSEALAAEGWLKEAGQRLVERRVGRQQCHAPVRQAVYPDRRPPPGSQSHAPGQCQAEMAGETLRGLAVKSSAAASGSYQRLVRAHRGVRLAALRLDIRGSCSARLPSRTPLLSRLGWRLTCVCLDWHPTGLEPLQSLGPSPVAGCRRASRASSHGAGRGPDRDGCCLKDIPRMKGRSDRTHARLPVKYRLPINTGLLPQSSYRPGYRPVARGAEGGGCKS